MSFATWSIRNPIPPILLFILLAVAGIRGFMGLQIQDLPDLALPTVSVTAVLPGAAPAQLETEVARPLEDALASLDGLKHTNTTITDGTVQIQASFDLDKLLSDALIETKDAVDSARSDLPSDLLQPNVTANNFGTGTALAYAISSSRMDEAELSWFVDDTLTRTVRTVPGVGRVNRVGGIEREVAVTIDPTRLAAVGATVGDVSRALREMQQQSSGGRAQLSGAEQSVRTVSLMAEASELARLPVILSNGQQLRLEQLAIIEDGAADRTQLALLDGKPVVAFEVIRAKGTGEVAVADGVYAALDRLKEQYPDIQLTPVGGSVDYTLEQYDGSMSMLYEGALLSIVVVWLFLRDWRATAIAATALPLSILPTFAAMAWFGFSLNTLTLLALTVVVGILVDDAIVEVENIERHRRQGKSVMQATEEAVEEIAKAVIATTLTLVAVFLPTAMMGGIPGLIFRSFGWTAVIAVVMSLLVARLLTPMLAAHFLKGDAAHASESDRVMRPYIGAVQWCLSHRRITMFVTTAFLGASLALLPLIPTGFLPPDDRSSTRLSFELPPGSPLAATTGVAEEVRAAISEVEGVEHVFVAVGAGGDDQAGAVRRASVTVLLAPRGERPRKTEIEAMMRERLASVAGVRFAIGEGLERLELVLASDDPQSLKAVSRDIERQMRGIEGLSNINSTASLEQPEIVIRPDLPRAAERGVTTDEIGEVVRVATSGDFDAQVARLNLDNRQLYIRVRLPDEARRSIETFENLRVSGREGLVPLSSVAELSMGSGPAQIDRYDRQRFIQLTADLNGMPQGEVLAQVNALPAVADLPAAVSVIAGGGAEIGEELESGFATALVGGLLAIFCVLILLFKDFMQPVTILSAIPLSIGGAFVALVLMGSSLSMPTMIGMVMLMGIVTKNSILLVEHAILGIADHGRTRHDALVHACRMRARPIVMTTVAMIAGMAPIALGYGADASFRQPMALAVIGGLLTSTALSLLVVPVVFTLVDDVEQRLRRIFARRQAPGPVRLAG
ncbi:efflux RND transporter permease subunit [Alteraurantiacibacter aquimixticola]|uniref:Efflux RND transporter permease subunit n=1 Tax=Alteraurantiacibacter aquimixticola TaxID=2489173 RepID=A0A4T3F4F9_9SPHN|nr:efflux RND transporter permease subunit [Alteraurantiacibacter aquimixticola]TIX51671.1 efflux RND transporter permease subunit [Alteraurantiacibacter aquimixticola]